MGYVEIGNRPVSDWSDSELIEWLNRGNGYRLRKKTAILRMAIIRVFDEGDGPQTLRQIYYALVSRGAISKTESAYNKVGYHLLKMRRGGKIPYNFIADNTRWMRKPDTYDSLKDFLKISQETYRRTLWANQNTYIEIWCEKDALAGVLHDVTEPWDVPLMVTRGFPSETFLYEAGETIKEQDKAVYIYYFGDYDPSGVSISETTEAKLRNFADGVKFHFEVIAVLPYQIDALNLPTRPTKKSDTRAKNWQGGSVELDAIPVATLKRMAEECITRHIDEYLLNDTRRIEKLERKTLEEVTKNLRLA